MRKLILASFIICLAGYCWGQMTPQYDGYVTYSTDSNNIFYQTIVVEGTTTGSCNTTCCQGSPYPPYYTCWSCQIQGCSTAVHTGTITNVVNGVGGTTTSPGYDPFSYMSYQTTTSVYVAPGGQVTNSCGGSVSCSVVGNLGQLISGCPTPIQHNYPNKPTSVACWVSQFYDSVNHGKVHHAEDIDQDNGNGQHSGLPFGTPVYASEDGQVVNAVSGSGSASYPACLSGPSAPANYVRIRGTDGYYTSYVHVTPTVSAGQPITAGQQIGVTDQSGCQKGGHVHMSRHDANGNPVNFTVPCTNPTPTTKFWDGVADDNDDPSL